MSGRKGNLASRSLTYTAPPTPSFLRALQAQVSSNPRSSTRPSDELDSLVTITTSSSRDGKRKLIDNEEELDSDDEINGAQVVVLKDGKHLTHEQALEARRGEKVAAPPTASTRDNGEGKRQSIAGSTAPVKKRRAAIATDKEEEDVSIGTILDTPSPTSTKPRSSGSNLDDVKQLIRAERQSHPQAKEVKEKTKQQKKQEKTAQARKAIARSGKGLSFDLDDE